MTMSGKNHIHQCMVDYTFYIHTSRCYSWLDSYSGSLLVGHKAVVFDPSSQERDMRP